MYCYRRTTPEGIVYFEVFRSNFWEDKKAGTPMNIIPEIHSLAYLHGVSETAKEQ